MSRSPAMPTVETITALDDPRVEPYRDVRDKDLRGRDKLFMAESELVIRRLLRTPERLHSLFLSPNKYERLRGAIDEADLQAPVYLADVELMTEIAGFHIHRGVLAAGCRPQWHEVTMSAALGHLREKTSLTLLLAEGIMNVDNMGGLFRNAAAFGVGGVLLDPACCDPLYRKAIRVSAGHTLSVPWAVSDDWTRDLRTLKETWGMKLIGAESDERAVPLWDVERTGRTAIIFGAEHDGLREATMGMCDQIAMIPMQPGVPSLNVAVASAVFLYALLRDDSKTRK